MKNFKGLLLILCLLCSTVIQAQDDEIRTVDIDSVRVKGFGGVRSIFDKNSNEVISHYMYYNSGNNMEVIFLDLDLQITKRVPLPLATGAIQEAVYNGESILFWTIELGNAQYYILGMDGTILGQFGAPFFFTVDGTTMPDVVPSEIDGGYYILRPGLKDPSLFNAFVGYDIVKVDKTFTTQWSKSFYPLTKKEGKMLQIAVSGFDRLLVIEANMSNWLTNKMTGTELVCFDANNGDELYRVSLFDQTYTSLPSQIVVSEDGGVSLGGEYFKGDKTKNTSSEGIFVSKLDASGKELLQNRSTWDLGIQQQMKREKFSFSGKNKVLFHDLIPSEDGGFQLIGESFSKKQTLGEGSALGMAAQIAARAAGIDPEVAEKATQIIDLKNCIIALASGRFVGSPFHDENRVDLFNQDNIATPTILTIQEMMVFDYDANLELTSVNKIDKPYTKVYSYPPFAGVGGLTLAKIMKGSGFFDYSFTSTDPQSGKQIMVFNSMMSTSPSLGIVDIEKGSESVPRQFVIKNLKKYGGFDEAAEEADAETATNTETATETTTESTDKKAPKIKYSNAGVTKANGGKVLIYYIEKEKKSKVGTLKMLYETINTGL